MRQATLVLALLCAAVMLIPAFATAAPVNGIYRSVDFGAGNLLLTGRASTWRSGVNSGLPHVLHIESWNGTALGTQWAISCPTENTQFTVQDFRVGGTGIVRYTSVFQGGTFTFLAGGWPWGSGTGTLGTTNLVTDVQYYSGVPVGSVVNGNTSGTFSDGCALTFAIANGAGIGETSSLYPMTKPADYPTFLNGSCGLAPPTAQFGSWGTVTNITLGIHCPTPTAPTTWGKIRTIYR